MKRVIIKFISALLILLPITKFCFPQAMFTPNEIDNIYSNVRKLEISDSLKTIKIKILEANEILYVDALRYDSLELGYQKQLTSNATQQATIWKEYSKSLEPKWYNSKILWYLLGTAATLGTGYVYNHTQ